MYLSLLMPICFFDGKMNIVGNTYLKILRKEKTLLLINAGALLFCGMWSLAGGYIFNSLYFIIVGMIITVALRSIIAECIIVKCLDIKLSKAMWFELILVSMFLICSAASDMKWMLVYVISYFVYLWFNRNEWLILFKKRIEE